MSGSRIGIIWYLDSPKKYTFSFAFFYSRNGPSYSVIDRIIEALLQKVDKRFEAFGNFYGLNALFEALEQQNIGRYLVVGYLNLGSR